METHDQQFLASIPQRPPRSKLEPHLDLVRALRRKGQPFQEIARILLERFQLHASVSTIHSFLSVRDRQERKAKLAAPVTATTSPHGSTTRLPPAPDDHIETLRRRPPPSEKPKRFTFTPGEPLQVPPRKEQP